MSELFNFCILILESMVSCWFGLDLGGYSFGEFLVAVLVVSVFVSSLVISFRGAAGSPGSVTRPKKPKKIKSGSKSKK